MSSGLVGHWKFNEKSGITANDSSRYRNTGTLTGATHLPKWGEKGIIFDGVDDYVNAGNNASLNMVGGIFTVSYWMRSTSGSLGASGFSGTVVHKGTGDFTDANLAQKGYLIGTPFRYGSNRVSIRFAVGNGTGYNAINYGNGDEIENGNWHFIVGVSNATSLFTYVDGVQTATTAKTKTGNISVSAAQYIGSWENIRYFNGSIDEVRIYNRALSASEITRLYNSTKHKYI